MGVPKLCSNIPTTSVHPSTMTNKMSFSGKLTIVGGNISMPIDTVTVDTTKSRTKNGRKIWNPIRNAILSSLITNAGSKTVNGTSWGLVGNADF